MLTITSVGAVISYVLRKPEGNWGVPKTTKNYNVGSVIVILLVLLGILLPLFGVSLIGICLYEIYKRRN